MSPGCSWLCVTDRRASAWQRDSSPHSVSYGIKVDKLRAFGGGDSVASETMTWYNVIRDAESSALFFVSADAGCMGTNQVLI
jgi:hypothetical protein